MQSQHLVAVKGDGADVTGVQALAADEFDRRLGQFVRVEGDLYVVGLGGLVEPVEMLLPAEDRRPLGGVVTAHALEDARPVVQRVREHVNLCLVPVDELAVHPDPLDVHLVESHIRTNIPQE